MKLCSQRLTSVHCFKIGWRLETLKQKQQSTKTMHLPKQAFEKWRMLYDTWAKKTKRKRITYGKPLQPLADSPVIPKAYIKSLTALLQ
jgi:hypothetical protein